MPWQVIFIKYEKFENDPDFAIDEVPEDAEFYEQYIESIHASKMPWIVDLKKSLLVNEKNTLFANKEECTKSKHALQKYIYKLHRKVDEPTIIKCIDACFFCDYKPSEKVKIAVDHMVPLILCLHMDPCPGGFNETLQKLKRMWDKLLCHVSEENLILYVIDVFRKCN